LQLDVAGRAVFAGTGGAAFEPGRAPVVFLHGAGMDHSVWASPARYFAHHGHGVLAPDLPGHGRSAGPPLDRVPGLADWLLALLDAARIERAMLVGHSMGAAIALEFTARHPERVRMLALLGAALRFPVNPRLLEAARSGQHLAAELMTAWGHDRHRQLGGHRMAGLWMLGASLRLIETMAPGVLFADLSAVAAYEGGQQAARKVACPALVVIGEYDLMTTPKAGHELAALLAGCRTEIIDEAGHMMMIEQPDATLDALRDFLR
jgi:pimeloyl-ACP methyl ester carboxylesterase